MAASFSSTSWVVVQVAGNASAAQPGLGSGMGGGFGGSGNSSGGGMGGFGGGNSSGMGDMSGQGDSSAPSSDCGSDSSASNDSNPVLQDCIGALIYDHDTGVFVAMGVEHGGTSGMLRQGIGTESDAYVAFLGMLARVLLSDKLTLVRARLSRPASRGQARPGSFSSCSPAAYTLGPLL